MDLCLDHEVDGALVGEALGDAGRRSAVRSHLALLHAYLRRIRVR
jgi:hypothetical protein